MFNGYLEIGGREAGNRRRAFDLVQAAPNLTAPWLRLPSEEPTAAQLSDPSYSTTDMRDQPWFDADVEASRRFYGFYPLSITNISDSTWVAEATESTRSGGTISRGRYAVRQVRVRGFMTGLGEDALEYGISWLQSLVEPGRCELHESVCGETDVSWLASAPRAQRSGETEADYQEYLLDLRRYLHGVKLTSGPLVLEQYHRGNTYGYEVEFTLGSQDPHVYTRVVDPRLATSRASIVLASPFNVVPTPSAELASGTVVLSRNLAKNPSLESGEATYWAAAQNGTLPVPTGSVVTELAAEGTRSYRARLSSTAAGDGDAYIEINGIDLAPYTAGTSVSLSVWGAAFVSSGTASIDSMRAQVEFLDSSSSVITAATRFVDSTKLTGNVFIISNMAIPTGAASARVLVFARGVTMEASAIVDLYADAVAFMVP